MIFCIKYFFDLFGVFLNKYSSAVPKKITKEPVFSQIRFVSILFLIFINLNFPSPIPANHIPKIPTLARSCPLPFEIFWTSSPFHTPHMPVSLIDRGIFLMFASTFICLKAHSMHLLGKLVSPSVLSILAHYLSFLEDCQGGVGSFQGSLSERSCSVHCPANPNSSVTICHGAPFLSPLYF